MHLHVFTLLFLAGCAGPAAHRALSGSAAEPTAPAAARPQVASTLASADPLAAPTCALPTAGFVACEEAPAPSHHHHHGGAPASPAPVEPPQQHKHGGEAPPPPEAPAPVDPHQHHKRGGGARPAPRSEAAPQKVVDPICGMTIDPATAKGGTAQLDGKTFHFCSATCRQAFLKKNPGAR